MNLIDKDALNADDFTFSGEHVASKARAFAFAGVTIALGSLGGSFVILALKYLLQGYTHGDEVYFGVAIVVQNLLIFLSFVFFKLFLHFSSMVMWFGRNGQEQESFGLY